ncbi:NAD(P)H-dependent flavin oxidoreductase [Geopsychrobacter electrodiphilus]|uniref:NAD(P)H-dependent flavin oxidoreductase n=1 Tax=Geopsychrobacter electrodiphilus TaxID=225196 RepID=UPI00037E6B04|nr:nitronate monooxygenase [Geopsychrobacter electrodiphilus]
MNGPFNTRITRLFGTRLPIVVGCMQNLSTADFVSAVAHEGMMTFLASATYPDLADLRVAIRRCKTLTAGRPFGVNVSMLPKLIDVEKTEQVFDLIIDEGVRFVETSGRSPEAYLPRLHAAGIKVIHKVPAVKYARKAQALGVDAVEVVGAECGGHPGMDMVGTIVQAVVAARDISIPLIIGGGMGTGAHLVAALAMGADGIIMGTRFLVAEEIWAHINFKQRLLAADETHTTLILGSLRNTMRALRNETTDKVQEIERIHGGNLELLMPHISGAIGRKTYETGDTSTGALSVGQAVSFADRVEPLADIVKRLENEAHQAMKRLATLYQ